MKGPSKKRLLFVDDEPNVLDGLQRMLRSARNVWDLNFASSGPQALEILSRSEIDVVVSDMRMPGMNGAELFERIRVEYPQVARIILSGQAEDDMIMLSVCVAHQYLSKPCNYNTLKNTVARACSLCELLENASLKNLVSRIKSLPSLPSLYNEITNELRSSNPSLRKVGEVIAQDIGMSAKILQLVNSAFFGFSNHISGPVNAVNLLGLDIIKGLVLGIQVFSQFDQRKISGFSIEQLWDHSKTVGLLAHNIAKSESKNPKLVDEAYIAGLLHDIGKLVLIANLPDQYREVISSAEKREVPLWQVEREMLGATHAEIGAYLLGLWGLPGPVVEAVAFHHFPFECNSSDVAPLTAVHAANGLHLSRYEEDQEEKSIKLDLVYLAELRLEGHVPEWQQIYRKSFPGNRNE